MAETIFSHRFTGTKSWDISLDCHNRKYRGVIRSKIVFLESVTFQFHARMFRSKVAQSWKRYGHFSTLGAGSLSVTTMLDFSGKANTSIHSLGEDNKATQSPLAIGHLLLLWDNQVDIKVSQHCKCISAELSFRTFTKKHLFIFFKIIRIYIKWATKISMWGAHMATRVFVCILAPVVPANNCCNNDIIS